MSKWNVSEEAINELKKLSEQLDTCCNSFLQSTANLVEQVDELKDGLGKHSSAIRQLVVELQDVCAGAVLQINKIVLKTNKAAMIREQHLNTNRYRHSDNANAGTTENIFSGATNGMLLGKQGIEQIGGSVSSGSSNGDDDYLTRTKPRDLAVTQQKFIAGSDGELIYNTPEETGKYLCPKQGRARIGFKGTCGLCSCANLLRMAGVNISEGDVIDYASTTNAPDSINKLCVTGHWFSGRNGGTDAHDRKEILSHFGIDSGIFNLEVGMDGKPTSVNIHNIAQYVSEGRGVIISVHAHSLWNNDLRPVNDLHAITVTSVKKSPTGEILGFYVNDTGKGGTYYYSADKILESLSGSPMNITYQIIR